MRLLTNKQVLLFNATALVVGVVPMVLFWMLFLRVPSISIAEAHAQLNRTNDPAVLVDVRPASVFAANHVVGAVNWAYESIAAASSPSAIPGVLQGKSLLVICDSGLSSAVAVRRLKSLGVVNAYNVAGGLDAWRTYGDGKTAELPFRPMSQFEQWLAVIVAFGVKPVYMLVSLGLILWLWRQRAMDLAMLRWGLIWFWLGENACTINFVLFRGGCDFWEYLHNYGMAAGFSMVIYALLEGFDYRVIKFSPQKERCAALSLCRACMKYAEAPCGLKRLFTVMIPALIVLALMPFAADLKLNSYNTDILGTTHNYFHQVTAQLFELRYCPALAVVLLAASWLVLMFKRHGPVAASKVLLAAALGPLSFGLLRLFFVSTFNEHLMWFEVWEEVTELLFIFSVAVVLWVFRERLLANEQPSANGQSSPTTAVA